MSLGSLLAEATSLEAQLALSYLVWPGEAPDSRVVDAWVSRQDPGAASQPIAGARRRLAVMAEQARDVWRCPGCGEEVPDGVAFVLAQEGQEDTAFSASGELAVIWDHVRRVRFHPAHFREKIGPRYYRTVD